MTSTAHTVERPQKNKEKLTRDEKEDEAEEEGSDFEEGLSIGDEECFLGSRFSSSNNNNNIGRGSEISSSPYSLSLEPLQQRRPLNEAMKTMMTMKTTDHRGSSKDFEEKAKRYDSLVGQMEAQMKALHEIPIGQMLSRNEDEVAGSAAVDEEEEDEAEEEEEDLERERRLESAVSRMKATLQEAEKRRQDLDHSLQEKVTELRALQNVKKRLEKQIERQLNGQAEMSDNNNYDDDDDELGVEQEVQEEEEERKTRTSDSLTFVVVRAQLNFNGLHINMFKCLTQTIGLRIAGGPSCCCGHFFPSSSSSWRRGRAQCSTPPSVAFFIFLRKTKTKNMIDHPPPFLLLFFIY